MDSPKVLKDNKRKIRVEFERTSLKERMKAKYLSFGFAFQVVWKLFRYLLLIGISYIILYPFIAKIFGSFMSTEDLVDATVRLIPKYPTLDTYKYIIRENSYFEAFFNTFVLSVLCAFVQTLICSVIGYGLAKFKFRGNKLVFMAVILTMIVPHDTIKLSMYMNFKFFDVFGIYGFISNLFNLEASSLDLVNTYWPLVILSLGGIAFKNGLYIFMMRQFFKGVPDELEEAAYIDGENTFGTFVKIILPISIPMMITIFLFAFSWQWTDNFYTELFFTRSGAILMPSIVHVPQTLSEVANSFTAGDLYQSCIRNTCGLMVILPLILFYSYMQRYLIQGIERSGIVG
ncbi:MAG: carbohydrate ABC transporter permease [Ruminococcaceae bacterium]|nr:carbohydrate ABC transporter permease [Oscillospiraceae bacterium]